MSAPWSVVYPTRTTSCTLLTLHVDIDSMEAWFLRSFPGVDFIQLQLDTPFFQQISCSIQAGSKLKLLKDPDWLVPKVNYNRMGITSKPPKSRFGYAQWQYHRSERLLLWSGGGGGGGGREVCLCQDFGLATNLHLDWFVVNLSNLTVCGRIRSYWVTVFFLFLFITFGLYVFGVSHHFNLWS